MFGPGAFAREALPWAVMAARLVLAAVFAVAGLGKVGDPASAGRSVAAYDLVPDSLAPVVGAALPLVEIAVAVLLVAGVATRAVALVAAVLLTVFTVAVASAWARGLAIDCGCFGGGPETSADGPILAVVRNAGLLLLAGLVAAHPRSRLSVDEALQVETGRGSAVR